MEFLEEPSNPITNNHSLWVEKYRPTTLSDFVGNDALKEFVKRMIEKKDVPQLLLHGPSGTGKTTVAKMLVRNIPCDHLYVNASSDNGIDTVREKLKNFASNQGFRPLKIVILDECDFLTVAAQAGLRNMTESYSAHTRFIFTCNYPEKIIPAIFSRCQTFEVKPLSKKEIAVKLVSILKSENVSFTQDDVVFIVNKYYPDIRKIINFSQQSNCDGVIKIHKENVLETDNLNQIIELLKTTSNTNATFNQIREIIADFDPNALETVYIHLFDKTSEYAKGKEALIIAEIAESMYQSGLVIVKGRDIVFLSCIYKILNHLK